MNKTHSDVLYYFDQACLKDLLWLKASGIKRLKKKRYRVVTERFERFLHIPVLRFSDIAYYDVRSCGNLEYDVCEDDTMFSVIND